MSNDTGNNTKTESSLVPSSSGKAKQKPFRTRRERIDLLERIESFLTSKFVVTCGRDTNDNDYESLIEFWTDRGLLSCDEDKNENDEEQQSRWYTKSHDYWQNQTNAPATVDGMLGGFSILTERDLCASRKFVETILETNCPNIKGLGNELSNDGNDDDNYRSRSCECGAGIGRITKGLMIPLGISSCDLVETSPRLLHDAPIYIGEESARKCNFICSGLQDFEPDEDSYDIIWVQWVIGYLTDWDFVSFLTRMGKALRKGGVIVIKDNSCNELAFLADCNDSDITRSFQYLMAVVKESGLRVVNDKNGSNLIKWQEDFPDDIWPVPMIALESNKSS
jgi:protein N-terminal methyltransferase